MSDPLRQLRTDKSVFSEESLGDNIVLLYLYTRDQTQTQHLLSHGLQEEAGYASVSESLPRLQHSGRSVTIKYTYQGDTYRGQVDVNSKPIIKYDLPKVY